MQHCPHHRERTANFVCDVCARYFCEECVGERYYPKPAFICHHCSGEKPYEPPPEPEKPKVEAFVPEDNDRVSLGDWLRRWLVPGIEWVVLGICVTVIGLRAAAMYGRHIEELVLVSNAPEDVSVYCLGTLDNLAYQGAAPSLDDIRAACPPPLEVTSEDGYVLIVSPDPESFGFTEIEVELSPMLLNVLE